MKRKIIYIEIDEEITSIIDKIRETEEVNIVLVVPKRARILQSIISLKLLKKESEKYGKNLIFVTLDRVGRHLASQVGFEVYQKITQGGKIVFPFEKEKKDKKSQFYLKEEGNHKKESETDFVDEEEFSENEPTKEKVFFEKKLNFRELFEKKEIKTKKQKNEESIEKFEEKKSIFRTGDIQNKNSNYLNILPFDKKFLIGFLVLGVILLLYIFNIVLPQAKINIYVKANQVPKTIDAAVSLNAQEIDYNKNIIPARQIKASIDINGDFETETIKEIKTKAVGVLKIKNTDTTGFSWQPRGLVTFSPENNLSLNFITPTPIYELKGGQEVQINIESENFGEEYNFPAGSRFRAKALIGKSYESNIVITAPSGTWGGANKKVKILSQSDIDKVKEKFISENKEILLNKIKSQLQNDEFLDERFIIFSLEDYITSPEINKEAEKFNLKGKLMANAFVFKKDDLKNLVLEKIKSEVAATDKILEDEINWDFSQINPEEQMIKIKIEALGWVVPTINLDELKEKIKSLSKDDAEKQIMKIENIKKTEISIFPSFKRNLPPLVSHIDIKIKPEK